MSASQQLIEDLSVANEELTLLVNQLQDQFSIDQTLATSVAGILVGITADQVRTDKLTQLNIKGIIKDLEEILNEPDS